MWLYLNSNANYQVLELGTGHQCNGTYNYYYWDYERANVWYVLGYQLGIPLGTAHTFSIDSELHGSTYYWYWKIDGVVEVTQVTSGIGNHMDAGLESYSSQSVMTSSYIDALQGQSYWGSWQSWSGRDGSQVSTPVMCGHFVSDTMWTYGENVSSC
jgi:hypothetical protein